MMDTINSDVKTYLSFYLGKELFGANVIHILEVLIGEQVTEIPKSESFISGIINFRGEIVTVIDFQEKLNIPGEKGSKQNLIIVVELEYADSTVKLGLLTEKVCKVFEMEDKELKSVPDFGQYYNPEYLTGVAKTNNGLVMLLDLEKVLNEKDVQLLKVIESQER